MKCLCCDGSQPEYSFRVLEVHTLHVRDFDGERVIQALGEEKEFSVCSACVSEEMRVSLFPASRLLKKCAGFGVLACVGVVLLFTLTLRDVMMAYRVLGPVAVVAGVSGIVGKVRETLTRRRHLEAMSETEREKACAWQCVIDHAPKKHDDNDITYIPIDEETLAMSEAELANRYNLLPAIAHQTYSTLKAS